MSALKGFGDASYWEKRAQRAERLLWEVDAVARYLGNEYGAPDCIDNHGVAYQSEQLHQLLGQVDARERQIGTPPFKIERNYRVGDRVRVSKSRSHREPSLDQYVGRTGTVRRINDAGRVQVELDPGIWSGWLWLRPDEVEHVDPPESEPEPDAVVGMRAIGTQFRDAPPTPERDASREVTLCEETGLLAKDGQCPRHGGDGCLRQYAPVEEQRTPEQNGDPLPDYLENALKQIAQGVWVEPSDGTGPMATIRRHLTASGVPEEVRRLLRDLRLWMQGDHYRFSAKPWERNSWATMVGRIDKALASAPAVTEWVQPAWRPIDTYPKDNGVYRNGTRVWLWHEKHGVVWGFMDDLPSGFQCELYRGREGRRVAQGVKAAKGLRYWMPPAPAMPEPPVIAAPQREHFGSIKRAILSTAPQRGDE